MRVVVFGKRFKQRHELGNWLAMALSDQAVFGDQEKKIIKCSYPLYQEVIEVRHRQASVLACAILAGTSEGLVGLRVLEGAYCRYCGTE